MIDIIFPVNSVSGLLSSLSSGIVLSDVSIVISWLALAASFPATSIKDTFVGYVLSANVSVTSILHVPAVTVP